MAGGEFPPWRIVSRWADDELGDANCPRYDERFYCMWRYYLLSCAGGFRSRNTQLWQIVMTRTGTPQPDCRFG